MKKLQFKIKEEIKIGELYRIKEEWLMYSCSEKEKDKPEFLSPNSIFLILDIRIYFDWNNICYIKILHNNKILSRQTMAITAINDLEKIKYD